VRLTPQFTVYPSATADGSLERRRGPSRKQEATKTPSGETAGNEGGSGVLVGIASVLRPPSPPGMGGNLSRPSIWIPVDAQTKEVDRVAQKISEVLQAHHKDFTGGSFLNAHSVLCSGGGAPVLTALLGDLAKVEEATIRWTGQDDE
jgi:hypothetical protein